MPDTYNKVKSFPAARGAARHPYNRILTSCYLFYENPDLIFINNLLLLIAGNVSNNKIDIAAGQ